MPADSLLPLWMDMEELRDLCFDLGIDPDILRGEGFSAKARELLRYVQRRSRLGEVVEWIRRERPDIEL